VLSLTTTLVGQERSSAAAAEKQVAGQVWFSDRSVSESIALLF
jgi:hypothetical protein